MDNFPSLYARPAQEIRDYYDSHPNLTLVELARRAGLTVPQVKRLLMVDS